MTHPNKSIYINPPTPEQILKVVEKSGLKKAEFERHHGLYKEAIKEAVTGKRNIPVKHWHVFLAPKNNRGKANGNVVPVNPQTRPEKSSPPSPDPAPIMPSKLSALIDSLGL